MSDAGGPGAPLVLLPGSLGTADVFALQLANPPVSTRVIAVDYPAGADPGPLAAGLLALLDAMGIGRANVLGSSFAAYWLQARAMACPEQAIAWFKALGVPDHPRLPSA